MITALTLSAIQYTALDGGLAANVPEHIRLIEDADNHGARLVVFPVLSLTGYGPGGLADPEHWVTAGDSRLDGLREICRRTGITAVVGAPFREADGTPRLASLVLHPNGGLDTGFQAWHHGPDQQFVSADDQPVMLDLDGWRIALACCVDTGFPATDRPALARGAAAADADIYAIQAVCTTGGDRRPAVLPSVHPAMDPVVRPGAPARDNRTFSLLANLGGSTELGPSAGGSGFWGPDGQVIRQAAGSGTEVLTATLQYGPPEHRATERAAPESAGPSVLPAGPG
ncbi:putative amidohydrolase [Arthrobacter ginsengisoli]|uniref:Amidohydrolase n=1 Tax=Arthrobacter ginsengisoli TaxID=1356565 RepID=A0ABU1U8K9_9MICC|nr:carbon-nitrogen hydrolase family protein [Arthrobacter ginsengisoli]MDR7081517.1 putative amidohydrolase [Arthrobacter ginsengisoli]